MFLLVDLSGMIVWMERRVMGSERGVGQVIRGSRRRCRSSEKDVNSIFRDETVISSVIGY